MSQNTLPATRSFLCDSCRGEIQIPYELPPTTAPCPHCSASLTSPPPPSSPPEAEKEEPIKLTPEQIVEETPKAPPVAVTEVPDYGVQPKSAEEPKTKPSAAAAAPAVNLAQVPRAAPQQAETQPGEARPERNVQSAPTQPAGSSPPSAPPAPVPAAAAAREPALAEMGPSGGEKRVRSGMHPVIPFLVAILLIVAVLVGLIVMKRQNIDPGKPVASMPSPEETELERKEFLRDGWRIEATNTLTSFLRAKTLDEKARHVIGGVNRAEEMRAFYEGAEEVDESDTPLESFSHFDLDIADKERGLFLMRYERPAQYDIKEFFRPVAPLEVQHRLEEPGLLLSAFAARENFAMEPVRVMAFFKKEGNRLLLDWDVFTQTKYRTLRHFNTYPQPGESQVFRVMVEEDIAPVQGSDISQVRYFRFRDPAHSQEDYMKIPVNADSEAGDILSDLAWIDIPGKQAETRYATIRIGWTDEQEDPRLVVEKILCWEFLGLGGVEGNCARATAGTDPEPAPDQLDADTRLEGLNPAPEAINMKPDDPELTSPVDPDSTTPIEPVGIETPGGP